MCPGSCRKRTEFRTSWLMLYIVSLLSLNSEAEQTIVNDELLAAFSTVATEFSAKKISNAENEAKSTITYPDAIRNQEHSRLGSRNRYFTNYANNRYQYEVLSNHGPSEINVETPQDKTSPKLTTKVNLPPWPSKQDFVRNSNDRKGLPQSTNKTASAFTDKYDSLAVSDTTRLRYDNNAESSRNSTLATTDDDKESALIPSSDRQSYLAPPSPFVVMNNHKPKPSEKDKTQLSTLDSDLTATFADTSKTLTSTPSSMSTKAMSSATKPERLSTPATENKKTLSSVTKTKTTPRPVTKRPPSYKPYEYTAYGGTTEIPLSLTTPKRQDSGHSVAHRPFRPLANFMSHAVQTVATYIHNGFLSSLLLLIPTAILGVLLL